MRLLCVCFSILYVFMVSAFAEDCGPVDLYEIPNSPLKKIPVEIQSLGTCYAYASAQLINYQLAIQGDDFSKVSPLWLAYAYAKTYEDDASTISGGVGDFTIQSIQKIGLCPRSVLEEALKPYYNKIPPEGLLSSFEKTLATLETRFESNSCEISPTDLYTQKISDNSCPPPEEFLNVDKFANDFSDILKNYSYMPVLDKMFSACKNRMVPAPYKEKGIAWLKTGNSSEKDFKSFSNNVLKHESKPFNVSICSNLFRNSDYKLDEKCNRHFTTVVGQRKFSGKCQLLIRDSNVQYKNDVESVAKHPWEHYLNDKGEFLGIWVDQDKIFNSLDRAFYLP